MRKARVASVRETAGESPVTDSRCTSAHPGVAFGSVPRIRAVALSVGRRAQASITRAAMGLDEAGEQACGQHDAAV